jgi:hypothetical protein
MSAAVSAYWLARDRKMAREKHATEARKTTAERRLSSSATVTTHAEVEPESPSMSEGTSGRKSSISSSVRGFFRAEERGGRGGEVKGTEKEKKERGSFWSGK